MFEVLMGNFKEEGISINDRSTSTTGKKRIILIATNRCTASYNCEKCDRQFLVRYQYKNHREKCKGTITTKCYICHQNLKHRNLLKQHILEVHHYCIKCQKTFPDTEHSQMHNNLICTRRYKCSVCDMKFQSSVHLRRHKKAKHDEIPPLEPQRLCEICGKEFDSVSNLRAHKQIHGDPIKCKICDRVLKNVLTLKQHMRLSHRQKGGPKSQCEHCGRVFWLPSELNRHVAQVHNGEERERKHACPMCDKKFYTKGSVRQHVKFKHISAPVASCEICQKDFPKRAYYEKHMEKHVRDNNEPRKCEICDREFASRLGLSKHLTTHGFSSGRKRRFKCSVCNLAFQLKISLIRHEKMHTETYKYRCNICYVKRFKTEEELRLHESQHRGPKNYKCQICGEAFSRTFILSNHMLNVHDMDDFLLQKSEILAKMKQVKNEQEEERDHPLVVEEDQLVDYQEVTSKTKIGHGGTDLPTLRFRNEEGVIYKLF
ncbi:zinc finger protein 85 isoform X2 [Aethina tumida]|nr:zinc finger protein 85 isoform X2 [Aethina tumida]XP_049824098.1 zinc finger protein 85 isoform X2 [Aethina tumida]